MTDINKITHPVHYRGKVEPIDLIEACGFLEDFCAGNVIKYTSRYKKKGGLDDLLKADYYLTRLISAVQLRLNQETGVYTKTDKVVHNLITFVEE